ncbi:hypothetical protein FNF27_00922 [Cafeteria roenbergensis]|uniref:Uncharacterized protein n=1 Tax=Cafeteria roenbergensis TaxID=33653 RepID=A0A5A8CTC3_CAFRO|nr:hypothetical protein FNF29_01168 [Cafeteria roenbergensis]KAA0177750.1 hypothetical protein FNF27_00922 [Cafeteria roenbergensis]|eukprot:KAA0156375.1 hypothetical protein FNF29_01168 [Cafeteria roenbergensis]
MALIPDKITFKRVTEKESICYRHFVFKYKDSADVGDEGSELHTGDVAKKLFGICGMKIDFGSDAGLALDVSKKILCLYNKYDVTSGGDSAPKAEILEPGLITMIMQTIMPCGSQLVYRIRDTDSDEDLWHIRTPEACCHIACCPGPCCPLCPSEVSYTFHICKADSKESEGTITVTAKTCLASILLASTSSISVDFPSESGACSVASKHAIMCAAMLLDAAILGSRSFCA